MLTPSPMRSAIAFLDNIAEMNAGPAGLERIWSRFWPTGGIPGRRGHSAGRSSDDYTLDASPEEMADGDPLMAEVFGALP
jgi:hypothetical protein